jgi:hypothetical protein
MVPDDGNWSCGVYPSNLVGNYTVTALQTYADFPASASSINVQVNTPNATITAPANGDTITSPTYVITGTGVPGAEVDIGGAPDLVASVIVGADSTWTSPTYTAMPGGYVATATQVIGGQPQPTPTSVSYTVQIQHPIVTYPQPNQTIPTPQLTMTGTAQPFALIAVQDVEVASSTTVQRAVDVDDKGNWSTSYLAVSGTHTYTVQQYIKGQKVGDPVGGQYVESASLQNVAIGSPTPNQTISTAVYAIAGTGQSGTVVKVTGAGLDTRWAPVDANGNWLTQYAAVAGNFTATATQIVNGDGANANGLNTSAQVSYVVAGAAVPPLSIDTPAENAVVGTTHTITGHGAPGDIVLLDGPGSSAPCSVAVATDGTWSCGSYVLTPGPYTVTATQWLRTTSSGLQRVGMPLVRHYIVRQPPNPVTIMHPTDGQVVTDAAYTIDGTGAAGASITVKGLGLPDRSNIPVQANGTWSAAYLSTPGSYTVAATEYVGGQQAGDPAWRSYSVSASTTALTIATPAENEIVDQSPYSIQGGGQPGATVMLSDPVDPANGTPCQAAVASEGGWSCGPYTTPPGAYWVQAQQSVSIGGTLFPVGDPLVRHYRVVAAQANTTPPVVFTDPKGPAVYLDSDQQFSVAGTAGAGLSVVVAQDGGPSIPVPVDQSGNWSTPVMFTAPTIPDYFAPGCSHTGIDSVTCTAGPNTITATEYKDKIPLNSSTLYVYSREEFDCHPGIFVPPQCN